MDEQKKLRINSFLQRFETSLDLISESEVRDLCLVDDEIQKRLSAIEQARKVIRENKITVVNVSSAIGVARSKLYYKRKTANKEERSLIARYIEYYSGKTDAQYVENEQTLLVLRNELAGKKQELERRNLQDAKEMELRCEIKRLQNIIKDLTIEVNNSKEIFSGESKTDPFEDSISVNQLSHKRTKS